MTEETSSPRITRESLDHWQLLKRDRMDLFLTLIKHPQGLIWIESQIVEFKKRFL